MLVLDYLERIHINTMQGIYSTVETISWDGSGEINGISILPENQQQYQVQVNCTVHLFQ